MRRFLIFGLAMAFIAGNAFAQYEDDTYYEDEYYYDDDQYDDSYYDYEYDDSYYDYEYDEYDDPSYSGFGTQLNTLVITNETDYEFLFIFISPDDSGYWGPEILGTTDTIPPGESREFYIHYPDSTNLFDVKIVDEDNDIYEIWEFEITDGETAYLNVDYSEYTGDTFDPDSLVQMSFTNELSYDIKFLFYSPSDSQMLGVDLLGSSGWLYQGDTFEFYVPRSDASDITYDVVIYDEDEDPYYLEATADDNNSYGIRPMHYQGGY